MRSRKAHGFTLIELLISATIAALLMSTAIVSYTNVNKKSRDAKRKADFETIRSALEICRSNYSEYPSSITTKITCTSGGVSTGVDTLAATPVDPKNSGSHVYTYSRPTTTTYTLSGNLELPADPTAFSVANP